MANVTIGQTPVQVKDLNRGAALIQNMGPDALYMDSIEDVTTSTGFEIAVDGVYETAGSGGDSTIFLVSAGSSVVRIVSI